MQSVSYSVYPSLCEIPLHLASYAAKKKVTDLVICREKVLQNIIVLYIVPPLPGGKGGSKPWLWLESATVAWGTSVSYRVGEMRGGPGKRGR